MSAWSISGFWDPLNFFTDPSSRIFWLHWVTAGGLLAFLIFIKKDRLGVSNLYQIFSKAYWFNKSTSADYFLMFLNSTLRTLVWLPVIGSNVVGTLYVAHFFRDVLGDPLSLSWPPIYITCIYMAIFFILDDLTRFLLHRAMHKIPILWSLHRLHHSATTLTPFTVFRVHPVESGLYFFRSFLVFSLVSGAFVWTFSNHLSVIDVLGVNIIGFVFNALFANLRHSHIWVGFGKWECFLVSPAQHQLHHELNAEGRNYGSVLSLWDRLAGSYCASGVRRQVNFGCEDASPFLQSKIFWCLATSRWCSILLGSIFVILGRCGPIR